MFGIQVGVSVNLPREVKRDGGKPFARILYNDETADISKARTFAFLDANQHIGNVEWQELTPDKRSTWLTEDFTLTLTPSSRSEVKIAKAGKL